MSEALTGSLAQLPLVDLLKMLAAGGQSGHLELSSGLDHGDLYLVQGELVHAECEMIVGEAAFGKLASWPNGQFRFEPQVPPPGRSIEKTLDKLLADSARAASEREMVRRVVPNMNVTPYLARKAPGPTVTIAAADWEIVALVDGKRTADEIAHECLIEDIDLAKTLYRLKLDGILELSAAQVAAAPAKALAGPGFFKALTTAVAAAMGPLAEIIIDDAVDDLGFTRENFPREGVASLAERISGEIREPEKRVRFQQTMLQMLRGAQQAA
ncbi:MAG: DUF4388 domain-containing protein [Dehalococcoidia bacterium]